MTRRTFLGSLLLSLISMQGSLAASKPTLKFGKLNGSDGITLIAYSSISGKAYVEYGTKPGSYSGRTQLFTLKANASSSVTISGLKAQTKYYFRLRYLLSGSTYLSTTPIAFTTQKASEGSVFAIQADPHMDENSSADVYNGTLDLIASSGAAFLIDLGDIFMVDKLADKSEANIRARYELMKQFYTRLKGIPLKIVLGNHDGELGYSKFNTKSYRAEYFPEQTKEVSYFAFTQGNSLHVALDPFTYTTEHPKPDGWQWTLGKVQYDWLVQTLRSSTAKYKFVYIHHLLVGDPQSRGGVAIASKNEWGGNNVDGTYGFDAMRPGWEKPIHSLLKETGVNIVFKGHDHLYVKEYMDGIVYQTLPQPSHPGDGTNSAVPYGYGNGKVVGGSGYLRVQTSDANVKVDFVKFDGTIADSYSI